MNEVDVAVFGAGVAGLTTALLCARAGQLVHVYQPSNDDGLGEVSLLHGLARQHLRQLQPARIVRRYAAEIDSAAQHIRDVSDAMRVPSRRLATHVITRDGHRGAWLQREAAQLRESGVFPYFVDEVAVPFSTRPVLCLDDQFVVDEHRYRMALTTAVRQAGAVVSTDFTCTAIDGHHVTITGPQHTTTLQARRIVIGDDVDLPGVPPPATRVRWEDIIEVDVESPVTALSYFVDDRVVACPEPAGRGTMMVARPSRDSSLVEWVRDSFGDVVIRNQRRRRVWVSPDGLAVVGSARLWDSTVHTIGATGRWNLLTGAAAGHQLADFFTSCSRPLPWRPFQARGTVAAMVNRVGQHVGLDLRPRPRFMVDSPLG